MKYANGFDCARHSNRSAFAATKKPSDKPGFFVATLDYALPGGSGCGLKPALMLVLTFRPRAAAL
jgi:hypothetical protein